MKRIRVLYISSPPFFDMDLSLINHLSETCDVHYLMDLPPYFLNSSAVNLNGQRQNGSVYNAKKFKELHSFKKYIPLSKFHIINRPSKKVYSYSNIKLQNGVVKFIDDLNPDVIHCGHFLNLNFLFFLLTNKKIKVLTVHDPFPHTGESSFRKNVIRKINFLFIKNIILLNNYQREKFVKKTSSYKFSSVLCSSLSIYEYLQDYKISKKYQRTFKILFFGRISMYKGIDDLLKAFTLLEKEYSNIELIIAGKGNYWFDISEYEKNLKIKIINRYIPNDELVDFITNATIVVCPYKDATQSGVIMSAFALNKPVVATKTGGLAEMIEDGKTGFLVPPNDVEALYFKIKELIDDRRLIKEMEVNIYKEYSLGDKSWSEITKRIARFYHGIVLSNSN